MLVLTRRVNESIIINDKIKVTVLGAGSSQIKLGIEAPSNIKIFRDEIYSPQEEGVLQSE